MTPYQKTTVSQIEERILSRINLIMPEEQYWQYEAVKFEVAELCRIAKELIDENSVLWEIVGPDDADDDALVGVSEQVAQ